MTGSIFCEAINNLSEKIYKKGECHVYTVVVPILKINFIVPLL